MNKLQKLFFILIMATVLVLPLAVMADNYGLDATQEATGNSLPKTVAGKSDIPGILGTVVSSLLGLIGVVFFILVLYAGLKWMMAMGNSEDVTKAKDILINAGIGLIIVAASYAITRYVFTSLGAGSNAGENAVGGSNSSDEGEVTDGDACKITKPDWGEAVVGLNGMWNCGTKKGSTCSKSNADCHPKCRYSNSTGKCIDTAKGATCNDGETKVNLCPGAAAIKCCVTK